MTQWLYISREHIYLKKLIAGLKKSLPNCEFCKIDLELEVLERYPFYSIVNKFRVINVGKLFLPYEFIEFYKLHQQHITVCFECKLKKEHIHRNERLEIMKSRNNICAKILVRKWLMYSKSRLLHKNIIKPRPPV
jgi:hypothetical protein